MSLLQRTIKLVLATCLVAWLADFLGLAYSTSAGIIAILSVTDTRRSTAKLAGNRFLSTLLALGNRPSANTHWPAAAPGWNSTTSGAVSPGPKAQALPTKMGDSPGCSPVHRPGQRSFSPTPATPRASSAIRTNIWPACAGARICSGLWTKPLSSTPAQRQTVPLCAGRRKTAWCCAP